MCIGYQPANIFYTPGGNKSAGFWDLAQTDLQQRRQGPDLDGDT